MGLSGGLAANGGPSASVVNAGSAGALALPRPDGAGSYIWTDPGIPGALYNFASANFLKWKKALIDVRLGTADAKILCVGDSTTTGIKSSTDATVPQNRAYPAQLAAIMNSFMVNAATGLATPKSLSSSQAADTRWSGGTGWALNSQAGDVHIGFGGKGTYWGSATANTALTFADPTITADTFDVYYLNSQNGSQGQFTVAATGGGSTTINEASASATGIYKVTVSAASAATTNVVTVTHDATTKKVYILGIEPYLSTTKKVRVGNAGAAGSETTDWVTYPFANTALTWSGIDAIKAYAPHLTIIDLGINDAGSSRDTNSVFIPNLNLLIAAAQVSGDVILKTMLPSNPALTPHGTLETAYVAAIRGLGLPVIDVFSRIGGSSAWAAYQAAGYMNSDGLHGSDYSYGDEAKIVLEALRQI